jgi:hypothetical protein
MWFSIFRLKPFDNRVYRRIVVRTVQFWRSTWLVEMCAASGRPQMTVGISPMHWPGL